MARRLAGAAVAGAALASASGCTVPVDAVSGISVTEDGRLLGVIAVCGHRIDGATLYVDGRDPDDTPTVGDWVADRPVTSGVATWTLDAPSPGWSTRKSLAPLASGTTYTLYGWTKDNSWSAADVTFKGADRKRLTPGTVRYDEISDNGDAIPVTVPMARFKAKACADE
ncbi:hypothetical protein OIB37_02050 [Streptomyces sp. NBC_00820]|uniref:hypothetical protein n=1 Tax=Streptomyces sp. NBC_00820 TaxID=2975842 RepID=UPI002ED2A86C|nr:hypothetical protein OIB37_02050 [Streptomyces sp. NBC_00820]